LSSPRRRKKAGANDRFPRVDALGQVTGLYEAFAEPRPALEIGLRWLAGHRPAPAADALVHGDFRTGNLMIGADGLHGVLDWELAHRGDPRQDLGWLCTKAWRFGSASPVGGFGARADLMAGYAAGGGTPPDEETQRWWELYGTVRWALLCRRQAERYLAEDEPSIELAVLGRRVGRQPEDSPVVPTTSAAVERAADAGTPTADAQGD